MMVEHVPERCSSQFADVRGIVDDEVKSFRRSPISYLREKCFILLAALEELDAFFGHEVPRQLAINANNRATRKIVTPQL
jgi:hypothetical protein